MLYTTGKLEVAFNIAHIMLYAIILGKCSYLLQILPPKNCFADKETIMKYTIWK